MTCKEAYMVVQNGIKELYEKYPEMNPFNPKHPEHENWNKAANKGIQELIKKINQKPIPE